VTRELLKLLSFLGASDKRLCLFQLLAFHEQTNLSKFGAIDELLPKALGSHLLLVIVAEQTLLARGRLVPVLIKFLGRELAHCIVRRKDFHVNRVVE